MKLGLDIGNSTVKGALLDDENTLIANIKFPSVVTKVADSKYLSYPYEEDFYIQVVDSALEHFEGITAIGEKAINMPGYQEFDVTSTSYKANNPITTALLFGALAEHVTEDGQVDLKLAVTVPIVEAKTLGLIQQYNELLTGQHVVMIYRQSGIVRMVVNVEQTMVLNEGQAGFLGLLDNSDAHFRDAMTKVYESLDEDTDPVGSFEDFLIVDIGEGTTDLAVFRNKRFNPDFSYSVTRGYGNLLEDAISNASRENLTIESRKELQKVLESTNKRRAERRELWEHYVTPTKAAFVDTVVDTILKTYGSRDYFDAIIFLGGGFSALTGYTVDIGQVLTRDESIFRELQKRLKANQKSAELIFGVPAPYSQGINERGLKQVLSRM